MMVDQIRAAPFQNAPHRGKRRQGLIKAIYLDRIGPVDGHPPPLFDFRLALSPAGDHGDFTAITKAVNGGTNGLQDRLALFGAAKEALA